MSGSTPKRSHEEGIVVGHSASKYPHEDGGGSYPKLTSTPVGSSEYHHHPHTPHPHPQPLSNSHVPYEQDSRANKGPRTAEIRDADRRSPLGYRVPPPSSVDPHLDSHQLSGCENRPELRDSKDVRDINRDSRIEVRDMYTDAKRDSQSGKGERDLKFENRADDNKETKEIFNDTKGEVKTDKDGHGQQNWKEQKEYHRGKRYSEAPSGNVDPWHAPRVNIQAPSEAVKEGLIVEEKDHVEGHETVGENRMDPKGEERFKDKERKRKDLKYRDWGDRDKERGDRRGSGSIQVGNASNELKEPVKEERESERWEKERKDQKDRERLKEREKDHTKRELWNTADKENMHIEKETDGSVRMQELVHPAMEQKKHKELDGWKINDKETREKRRERDADAEGERPEKRSKCNEKEFDDGGADVDGVTEKEKDFNYGVQQRKRMPRPRGSPQTPNREPRSRSGAPDIDGSQGKTELCSVVYKAGGCMQELIKLWKEYEASQSDKNGDIVNNGPTLEILIPAEDVTATNSKVRGGQLWGTDIYTVDSDLVAVLMHTGYCRPTASPIPPAIQELCATVRVLPPQDCYSSKLRNNVRSRAWGAGIVCSYRVERCCIVKKGGGTVDLQPCLTHSSTVEPTLAPMAVERTMTTRAAASNALRQQRFVREVTIQFNLCNEPWIKYSISIVADKGLKKSLFTSARLKKGEVLYLETLYKRFELCFSGEKMVKAAQASQGLEAVTDGSQNNHSVPTNGEKFDSDNAVVDVFRWSQCKTPLLQKEMRAVGIPLPPEHVEVLAENIDWEDIQWSQTGVWIAGIEYVLARVHFLSAN